MDNFLHHPPVGKTTSRGRVVTSSIVITPMTDASTDDDVEWKDGGCTSDDSSDDPEDEPQPLPKGSKVEVKKEKKGKDEDGNPISAWQQRENTRGQPPSPAQLELLQKWLVVGPEATTTTPTTPSRGVFIIQQPGPVDKNGIVGEPGPAAEILSMTPLFKQMLDSILGLQKSPFYPHKVPKIPTAVRELVDLSPRRGIDMYTYAGAKAHLAEIESTPHPTRAEEMPSQFTPLNNGWYNLDYKYESYEGQKLDMTSLLTMKAQFEEQIPPFPRDATELLSNPFLLFANMMPYPFLMDSYMHSNDGPHRENIKPELSLDDMLKICIFMIERRGDTFNWGNTNKPLRQGIISASLYKSKMGLWMFNRYMLPVGLGLQDGGDQTGRESNGVAVGGSDDDGDGNDVAAAAVTPNNNDNDSADDDNGCDASGYTFSEQLGALTKTILQASLQYSKHMSSSFSNLGCVVVDEVSVPWFSKLRLIHVVHSMTKVHRVAVEFKVLNCAFTGVRLAMILVLSKQDSKAHSQEAPDRLSSHQLHNFFYRTSWYVMRLLCDAGLLEESRTPQICIVDGAFASTILAAILHRRYNIHVIGPIKVCSTGSHKALSIGLKMPDQHGYTTRTKVNIRDRRFFADDMAADFDDLISPFRHRPRGNRGRFVSKATVNAAVAKSMAKMLKGGPVKGRRGKSAAKGAAVEPKPSAEELSPWDVTVYQYVDGVQNLVTTLPSHRMHHHISTDNLDILRKALRGKIELKRGAGFFSLTPRYIYRILFNVCDIQNRSLRRIGALLNFAKRFETKYLQHLVDLVVDCAHRVYTTFHPSPDARECKQAKFREMVIDGAYEYYKMKRSKDGLGSLAKRASERLEEDNKDQDLMMSLCSTNVTHFRKSIPGCDHPHNGVKKDEIMCSECARYPATFGCKACSLALPNQLFCNWCWLKHFTATHRTR